MIVLPFSQDYKHFLVFSILLILILPLQSQRLKRSYFEQAPVQPAVFQIDTQLNKKRLYGSSGIMAGTYLVSMTILGTAWYSQEDLSSFHFFDDSHEWKQIDKAGHIMGGFTCSRLVYDFQRWSGVPKQQALLRSWIAGFMMMNSIELLDGFGASWGFSWSDVGANAIGSTLAMANQMLWNENRIQIKASYIKSPYAGDPRYAHLFGNNYPSWFLKEYNGLAVWTSIRVHSFLPEGSFKDHYPRWLNLAIGYGAEGLIGMYRIDQDPSQSWKTREYRQYYLSMDIDLTQIRTKSGFLRALFSVVNIVRIPLPAIRYDREGFAFLPLR